MWLDPIVRLTSVSTSPRPIRFHRSARSAYHRPNVGPSPDQNGTYPLGHPLEIVRGATDQGLADAATVCVRGIHYRRGMGDERSVDDAYSTPDLGTAQQVDPPHFDELPPHPGTDMGSVWVTGNAARRVGGQRLRFWFRGALIVAFGVLVALLLVL